MPTEENHRPHGMVMDDMDTGAARAPVAGLPVAGYKPTQSPEAIAAVNRNKHIEELILRDMDKLKHSDLVDQRWLAISRTAMEEAFMAYNRAIFQPQRIGGDLTVS